MFCKTCNKEKDSTEFYARRLSCKKCVRELTDRNRKGTCVDCKKVTKSGSKRCRRCSMLGSRGNNWKGGRQNKDGYTYIVCPQHPYATKRGLVFEHRLVMEKYLNRYLLDNENIHHKNGVRNDNRIENLELWTTNQPIGSRVEDKIRWAINFLKDYGYEINK